MCGSSENKDFYEADIARDSVTNAPIKLAKIDSSKYAQAKDYCKKNGFDTTVAFMLNLRIKSAKKRFFVASLSHDSVLNSGLVTHGHCQDFYNSKPAFSNEPGSNCSSLGKYKVGGKYTGKFGTAYKLYGLEESNSNAFDRFVVLHGHSCVPDEEQTMGICQSEGCPTVSPNFLKELEKIIDNSSKSILLWIYY